MKHICCYFTLGVSFVMKFSKLSIGFFEVTKRSSRRVLFYSELSAAANNDIICELLFLRNHFIQCYLIFAKYHVLKKFPTNSSDICPKPLFWFSYIMIPGDNILHTFELLKLLNISHNKCYAWVIDYRYFSILRNICGSKESLQRGSSTFIITTYLSSYNMNGQK